MIGLDYLYMVSKFTSVFIYNKTLIRCHHCFVQSKCGVLKEFGDKSGEAYKEKDQKNGVLDKVGQKMRQ